MRQARRLLARITRMVRNRSVGTTRSRAVHAAKRITSRGGREVPLRAFGYGTRTQAPYRGHLVGGHLSAVRVPGRTDADLRSDLDRPRSPDVDRRSHSLGVWGRSDRVRLVLAGTEATQPMSAVWEALAALVDPLAAIFMRGRGEPDAESRDKDEPDSEFEDDGVFG